MLPAIAKGLRSPGLYQELLIFSFSTDDGRLIWGYLPNLRVRKQWRSQPKNLWGAKKFDFRRITLFCLEKRLSEHKMTIFSKKLGGHGPFAPPWLRLCPQRYDEIISKSWTYALHTICVQSQIISAVIEMISQTFSTKIFAFTNIRETAFSAVTNMKTKYWSRPTVNSDLRVCLSEVALRIDKVPVRSNPVRPIDQFFTLKHDSVSFIFRFVLSFHTGWMRN